MPYTDIKTFAQACKALDLDAKTVLPDVSCLPKNQRKGATAYHKLVIIAQALNEGWKPNWKDQDQRKWEPWFYNEDGSGFSFNDSCVFCQHSSVGSRLCFRSREVADYAATQFINLYNDFLK